MAIRVDFKRAVWLAAGLVLALACRQGLGATSIFEPDTLGISFQDETAEEGTVLRVPKLQLLQSRFVRPATSTEIERESQHHNQEQQQQGGLHVTGGQFLRPRTQATSKELLRRRHIAELLNALADDIPKQKKQDPKRQQQQQQQPLAARSGISTPAEMPIYRNSRTFPSTGGAGAGFRQASGSDQLLAIGWPGLDGSGPVVGGRGTAGGNLRESRKANFATTGIVWGATADGQPLVQRVWPAGGGPSASPPFFSQHTANAAAASTKSARARARPESSSSGELAQLTANSLDGGPSEPAHQQRHHPRSGSEEVALHTPLHSSSSSDYEWKRVENSRNSWNNLRGMWGKRSPASNDASNNNNDAAEQDSRLEQQQQQSDQYRELALLLNGRVASTG